MGEEVVAPAGRRRADAERNGGRILAAARELFAEQGPDAQMDAIAARAGVAVGTLYNHFATKGVLLAAALTERFSQATAEVREVAARTAAGADPWDEFSALFRRLAEQQLSDRAFKSAAAALGVGTSYEGEEAAELVRAVEELLTLLSAAGLLRADVGTADMALLLDGLPGPDVPAAVRERHLAIILAGLRAPA